MVELSDRRSAISDGLVERICAALGFLECVRGLLEQHVLSNLIDYMKKKTSWPIPNFAFRRGWEARFRGRV